LRHSPIIAIFQALAVLFSIFHLFSILRNIPYNERNGRMNKGVLHVKCGAKCFLVEVEKDGIVETIAVDARTAVSARKVIRKQLGDAVKIVAVKADKKKS